MGTTVLNGDRLTVGRPMVVGIRQHHCWPVPFDFPLALKKEQMLAGKEIGREPPRIRPR